MAQSMPLLRWMSEQGWAELYISDKIANPTEGAGAVLFSATAPSELFMLHFTMFNDAAVPLEYVVETDTGAGWEEQGRWTVHAKLSGRFSLYLPLEAGNLVRVAVVSNPAATGVSLAAVEYLQNQ